MWKDFNFTVKCNEHPEKVIHVVAENSERAKAYVKDMYAEAYTIYADDRYNKWSIKEKLFNAMTPEIMRFVTPVNKNGNTYQLKVDVANRRYAKGNYLFIACREDIHLSKKEMEKIIGGFEWFGWTEVDNL